MTACGGLSPFFGLYTSMRCLPGTNGMLGAKVPVPSRSCRLACEQQSDTSQCGWHPWRRDPGLPLDRLELNAVPATQARDVIPLPHRFLFIANDAHDTKHSVGIFIIPHKMWMKREEKEVSFRNPEVMRQFNQSWGAWSYSRNSCSPAKNNKNKINKRRCRRYEQSQGKNLCARKWLMNKRSLWKSNKTGVQYPSPAVNSQALKCWA